MKAIKSNYTTKQLIMLFSMLLFLFTAGENLYSQQKTTKSVNSSMVVNTVPSSPLAFEILQSAPEVLDANTTFSYSILRTEEVEFKLFDQLGREMKTLESSTKDVGTHNIELSAANLKAGIYFYSFRIGDYKDIKKISIVK